jgi:acetyl-CoA synthetase
MRERGAAETVWPTIKKARATSGPQPNLVDYAKAYATFSWDRARDELIGAEGGAAANIAFQAVDRHANGKNAGRVALRFLSRTVPRYDVTYGELQALTGRFANVLGSLGVAVGASVFSLLGRVPELYVAALGTLKASAVFCPLFSAFGPEPIHQRLALGDGRVLVTTAAFYRRKVAPIIDALPGLAHVLLVDGDPSDRLPPRCHHLPTLMAEASADYSTAPTDPEQRALLHFTSGTTGTPKGAVHVHDAVVSHHITGSLALDMHDDDVFWCTADPGWVTGTSYGIISPLTHGLMTIVDEADFDAARWYEILEKEQVSIWYTAPTALRMLMKAGGALAKQFDLSHLRFIASVGEPLNPQVVLWGQEVLGRAIHDNWWQTETGGIMIANFAASDIWPGSMGRPLPGIEAAVAERDADGELVLVDGRAVLVTEPEVEGELVLRRGWPSMFRGYYQDDERYARAFVGDWYRTGDLVKRDSHGYYWFVSRGDDVIKSAGHLIGPFEVESTLLEHPSVAEAGVIGLPDPVIGETVKAFVTLRPEYQPSDELRLELIGWGRKHLGAAVAPRDIAFDQHLPHTSSGKIMRRLLRARELGLPEGDTSTLEATS